MSIYKQAYRRRDATIIDYYVDRRDSRLTLWDYDIIVAVEILATRESGDTIITPSGLIVTPEALSAWESGDGAVIIHVKETNLSLTLNDTIEALDQFRNSIEAYNAGVLFQPCNPDNIEFSRRTDETILCCNAGKKLFQFLTYMHPENNIYLCGYTTRHNITGLIEGLKRLQALEEFIDAMACDRI